MIAKPRNYLLFTAAVVGVGLAVFPYPQRLFEMYLAVGRLELAEKQASIVINTQGGNRRVLSFLARQAEKAGDPEVLIDYYRRMIEIDPKNPANYQHLADTYIWSGQPDLATSVLEDKLKLTPGDLKTLWRLADLYVLLDRPKDLIRVDERLLDYAEDKTAIAQRLAYHYSLAGMIDKELALRRELAGLEPDDKPNLRRLAELFEMAGLGREGLTYFAARLRRDPHDPELARLALGLAVAAGGLADWEKAAQDLERALGGRRKLAAALVEAARARNRTAFAGRILADYALAHPDQTWLAEAAVELFKEADALDQAVELLRKLTRARPGDERLALKTARLELENNDPAGAYDTLSRLVEARPQAEEAWRELLRIAGWTGRPDDERRALVKRLEHRPDDLAALERLAAAAMAEQAWPEAEKALRRLTAARPKEARYWRMLGRLYQWSERPKMARRAYLKLAELGAANEEEKDFLARTAPPPPAVGAAKPPPAVEVEPEPPLTLARLRARLQKKPGDRRTLSAYLEMAGYTELAPEDVAFLRRLAKRTDRPELLERIGRVFLARDMVAEALPPFEKLARLRPGDRKILRELAQYYDWAGRPAGKLKALERLIALSPADAELRLSAARSAVALGDDKAAASHYLWLEEHARLAPAERAYLADLLARTGQKSLSLALCRKILSAVAADARTLQTAGETALRLDSFRLAAALLKAARRKDPGRIELLKPLAQAELALGRKERAAAVLRLYVRSKPDYEALFQLGEILLSLGRRREAMARFAQAEKLIAGLEGKGRER